VQLLLLLLLLLLNYRHMQQDSRLSVLPATACWLHLL